MNKLFLFGLLAFLAVAVYANEVDEIEEEEPWWKKKAELIEDLNPLNANRTHFIAWMVKHGKAFKGLEFEARYKLWKKEVKAVWEHNHSGASWEAGLNDFSAHTKDELKNLLGLKIDNTSAIEEEATIKRFAPASIDWQTKNAVSSVKDQKQCGGCWAFSAAAALEGGLALAGKGLKDLSPQQLIDCANVGSCNGGDPIGAIRWASSKGETNWQSYPYAAKNQNCQGGKASFVHCNGIQTVRNGNDNDLVNQIAQGPTSVCFHVQDDFFRYKSGVYDGSCPTDINHAVLATGYATNCAGTGKNCYMVKNQWGTGFGIKGYFMIARGHNECGIATYASRPTGCSN